MPTELPTPRIENKDATIKKFLAQHYGLKLPSLKPLIGYYDLNYHVTTPDAQSNPYNDAIPGDGFFLKISNLKDSKRPEFLSKSILLIN